MMSSTKPSLMWRVNEIVIASVVAVACSVAFWVWNIGMYPAAKTVLAAAAEFIPLISGAWLLAGVLGGYLIRKPGAALYCELIAAVVSVFLGSGTWGLEVVISGLVQGFGAELAFALTGYRLWNLKTAIFAGGLSGVFMGVSEIVIYYPENALNKSIIYVVCAVASGVVLAGVLSWALTKALAKTGVLSSLASGVQARTASGA